MTSQEAKDRLEAVKEMSTSFGAVHGKLRAALLRELAIQAAMEVTFSNNLSRAFESCSDKELALEVRFALISLSKGRKETFAKAIDGLSFMLEPPGDTKPDNDFRQQARTFYNNALDKLCT